MVASEIWRLSAAANEGRKAGCYAKDERETVGEFVSVLLTELEKLVDSRVAERLKAMPAKQSTLPTWLGWTALLLIAFNSFTDWYVSSGICVHYGRLDARVTELSDFAHGIAGDAAAHQSSNSPAVPIQPRAIDERELPPVKEGP